MALVYNWEGSTRESCTFSKKSMVLIFHFPNSPYSAHLFPGLVARIAKALLAENTFASLILTQRTEAAK